MFTTSHPNTALRNYLLLTAVVVITSLGISDIFTSPSRVAQQDRLDNYGQYVGVGLVATAQSFVR
jgi:hypothetical protein